MPTIRELLQSARLELAQSTSASLDAQMLLCEVLNVERPYLLAHSDDAVSDVDQERFSHMVQQRANGMPVAYILGRKPFYDREFDVTPAVLIPRPETELLLEEAIKFAGSHVVGTAVDVGTGSGALAVSFAAHVSGTTVYATDISSEALAVARGNATKHDVDVKALQGNLLQPIIALDVQADLVMANLPYIASDEVPTLDVSHYEPHLALDGGQDGLDLVRELLSQVPMVCRHGALILLEIGAGQGTATLELASTLNPAESSLIRDYAGHDRIVRIVL